jgi:hypothetical protein
MVRRRLLLIVTPLLFAVTAHPEKKEPTAILQLLARESGGFRAFHLRLFRGVELRRC